MAPQFPKRILVIVAANASYGREVVQGILDHSQARQLWEIYYQSTSNHPLIIRGVCEIMKKRGFEGVIGQLQSDLLFAVIQKMRIPAVDVSGLFEREMPTLRTDVKKAGRLAARHLLDRGLRNFGFYSSSIRNHPADMYEGIRRELGKSARDCRIFDCGPSSPEDALAHEKQFKRLLAMPGIMAGTVSLGDWLNGLPKPAGIIATTESEAADIIWTCRRQGIRVPEDLAVIGYGNDDTQCILTIPPISSIMVPAREIGYRASALLERMIRGAKPPRKPILFPPLGVAARQSTDLIYAADPDLASASRYIREHLGEPIAVSDIVRHVAVSRRSLERRFVKTFGRTLGDEILRVKIESATSLLLGSDMKVPQIAAKVGLPAYSTFLRKFRHATGLSPAEFRVRHLRGLSTSLPSPAVSWLRAPKGLRVGDTQRGAAVTGESQNRCSLRNLRSCHRILEQRIQQATGSWQ